MSGLGGAAAYLEGACMGSKEGDEERSDEVPHEGHLRQGMTGVRKDAGEWGGVRWGGVRYGGVWSGAVGCKLGQLVRRWLLVVGGC